MGNKQPDFASRKLRELAFSKNVEIGFVPLIQTKENGEPNLDKDEKTKTYSNPYDEYLDTWEPGDPIPLIPPGKTAHWCNFTPSLLKTDSTFYEHQDRYKQSTSRKSVDFEDIDYKVLGRKLKDSVESLLRRAAGARGLWVDDKNKLRCPPGTPAANQFTDITGSNCFIQLPRSASGTGARMARRAVGGIGGRSAAPGQRVEQSFDAARATREQIVELGLDGAQRMMAPGGRVSPTPADVVTEISGAMRMPRILRAPRSAGYRAAPKPTSNKVWQLGLREQIWRGKRATQLADTIKFRIRDKNTKLFGFSAKPNINYPGPLMLDKNTPLGDLRDKEQLRRAVTILFPNVDAGQINELVESQIPTQLSWREKQRAKEGMVAFWEGLLTEAIDNREAAEYVTQIVVDGTMDAAFKIDMDAFAPSITTGGRRASMSAAQLARQNKSMAQGGVHLKMVINPAEMYEQMVGGDFDRNGRANGVRDTVRGDMHYIAVHEFGHLAHFTSVMNALGFNVKNLQKYPTTTALVSRSPGVAPQWEPEEQTNAWIIDFTKAANPTNNPSIQLLIDSAQNLSTRRYVGYRGYTREELRRDLDNFHNALFEAIENNITDTDEERIMMRKFTGGTYASTNNIETRAEYYAARRLFGQPGDGIDAVEAFSTAIEAEENSPYTAAQAKKLLDDAGEKTFGVKPDKWNISGRMAPPSAQPTLKTQAVRRVVNSQSGPRGGRANRSISGSMESIGIGRTVMSPQEWRSADTLSSPSINVPTTGQTRREKMPPMLMRTISGEMSSANTGRAIGRVTGARSYSDLEIDSKIHEIGGERVVFDSPINTYDDPSIKVVPVNPFEISGYEETSKKGRDISENWAAAHVAKGSDGDTSTDVEALLYAGTRGDAASMKQFEELAERGKREIDDERRRLKDSRKPTQQDELDIAREKLSDITLDDLYVVHETKYKPEEDEDGNIQIRPLADFDSTTTSGEVVRVPRHTVHFAVNHLAGGHVFRQRSNENTYIVIAPLSEVLKDNPDSLDILHSVDTVMTPKPGEGLKFKSGKFRLIDGTPDTEATKTRVNETLKELGAKKLFAGESAEGSTRGTDALMRKLGYELGVANGIHSNHDTFNIEANIIRGVDGGMGSDPNIGARAAANISRNHLMRIGSTNMWSPGKRKFRESISGMMSSPAVPRYPRTPTYGPMLGRFDEIFDGVKDWNDFKTRYNAQEIVFLDYETTGLVFDEFGRASSNGAPVQIGAVKVRDGQVVDRFNVFVNPGEPLGEWSRNNLKDKDGNPLTDEYLSRQASIEDAHRQLAQFAGPDALMGVQNAAFDKDVLDDALRKSGIEWKPSGWIDLKDMASMTLPRWSEETQDGPFRTNKDGSKSPSNGLADITRYLGVELGSGHHNADRDAEATAESMGKLIDGAINRGWSPDVLDVNKRRSHVQRSQDAFDRDIKLFETQLAEYKKSGVSGKMSAESPKTRDIKRAISSRGSGSEVGGRQTRDYYTSLPKNSTWMARTIEETEPERLAKRKEIIDGLKSYAETGNVAESTPTVAANLNGLDPEFMEYIRSSSNNDLMSDLRQAAIEFHSGIDRRARVNVPASSVEGVLGSGMRYSDSTSKPEGLRQLRTAYNADIGIHPQTDPSAKPVLGYVVHGDTLAADEADIMRSFEQKELNSSPRYDFNLYDDGLMRNKRGFGSVYGEAEIVLRPETGERISYGNGDAINNHIFPVALDSADPDIIGRALIDPHGRSDERDLNVVELLYGKYKNNYDAYRNDNGQTRPQLASTWSSRDVVILGGFEPSEIEEIRVPFKSLDTSKSTTASDIVANSTVVSTKSLTGDEKKMLVDVLSGMDPVESMPKNIAVRIDNIDRFKKLNQTLGNLRRVEAAFALRDSGDAHDIRVSVTNQFGLDIFSGISFDSAASKNSDSRDVLRRKIEKLMAEMIDDMRRAKKQLEDNK